MTIPFRRYVDITSGVGAGADVARRDLICRVITSNDDLPTNSFREFSDPDSVGDFFGTGSEEFRRAQFYFRFVSKIITRPKLISFGRWARTAEPARIYGSTHATLTALQEITAGTFALTIGGSTQMVTALNFSSDNSFDQIAAELQVRIRTLTGSQFADATVIFNSIRNRFEIVSGEEGDAAVSVAPASANDAAGLLGLSGVDGIMFSAGSAMQSVTEVLTQTAQLSNNFGSFVFNDTLTEDEITEASTWNDGQNVLYQYHVPVLPADAATISGNLINLSGTGITLTAPDSTEFPELLPCAVLAATDYTRRASVQNYMFQTASLTPTVTTDTDADLYDDLRVNYYGQTQTAGQIRNFYQRGVLTGTASDPVDMNTFANEQWLKDDAGARIMSLLLSQARVPANQNGTGQLLSVIQGTIDQALDNGTIATGSTLTDIQRVFVTEQTGDELAWYQVQTSGYWVDAEVTSTSTNDGRTEFCGEYTLIYSKDDVIRKVRGTHTLI